MSNTHALAICLLLSVATTGFSAEYYVAPTGDDASGGTIESPFRSIQKAADLMSAGDTCYLRAGRYFDQTVQVDSLSGTAEAPITFAAYQNEKVIVDGTMPITGPWVRHRGSIYKAQVDRDVWQLFVGGKMMVAARWPNAQFDDQSIWDRENHWAHGDAGAVENGVMIDAPHGDVSLAASGLDMTGAMGILNVGSFKTFARQVENHRPGKGTFTYEPVRGFRDKHHYYYLEGKLSLLDTENEWFYDRETKTVYLWAPGGGKPQGTVYGKVQSYAFDFEQSDYVHLRGINFLATTFRFERCKNVLIEDCDLRYPSCTKRMLGSTAIPEATVIAQRDKEDPSHCIVRNCTFENTDGHAIYMRGSKNVIENCDFKNIDFSAANLPGLMLSIYMEGVDGIFRRNTVRRCSASSVLAPGESPIVELNDIAETGFLQSDGSLTHCTIGEQPNSQIRYNWFHDTVKYGARFDAPIPPVRWGHGGYMHHNVLWRANGGLMIKGEYHHCYNNTAMDCLGNGIVILDDAADGGGGNVGTIVRNNFADQLSGHRKKFEPVPGVVDHNWNGYETKQDYRTQLRDPDNLDFRPRADSQLRDGGITIPQITTPQTTVPFVGHAPDVGAYEFGADEYWIPGRKLTGASRPVPPIEAISVKKDADLMWLGGYRAQSHDVYFGADRDAVVSADRNSPQYRGNQTNNIHAPDPLQAGKTYYWRVDAVEEARTIRGSLWEFVVEE